MESMLSKLAQERDNLLLGEVAALLHEMSKLDHNFILSKLKISLTHPETGKRVNYATFVNVPMDDPSINISLKQKERFLQSKNGQLWVWNDLEEQQITSLRGVTIDLCDEKFTLSELLAFWHWLDGKEYRSAITHAMNYDKNEVDYQNWLIDRHGYALWLLDVCHGKAQVDKGEDPNAGIQQSSLLWVATAFGLENESFVADDLTAYLKRIQFPLEGSPPLHVREQIVRNVREPFLHGLGDTQRPINEITLWDWSWSTAALYKSALAQLILTSHPFDINQIPFELKTPQGWKWRTLHVTVDVLGLLAQGQRLSDILGYRRAVDALFQQVKDLVEVTYPMGNELYRDSTGIYFTFPAIAEWQSLLDELALKIQSVVTYPELSPIVAVGDEWGEQPGTLKWRDAPLMLATQQDASKKAITGGMLPAQVPWEALWPNTEPSDICPVCGVRPLNKPQRDVKNEQILYREQRCSDCAQHAGGVRHQWEEGARFPGNLLERETIWLDEIADEHDRVALIVGRFHVAHWLDGSLIRTMAGSKPADHHATMKEPSPARIMRVWRTAEEFWTKSVQALLLKQLKLHLRVVPRITWRVAAPTERVLDGTLDGQPISLFKRSNGTYLIISNPQLCSGAIQKVERDKKAELHVRADNGPWHDGLVTAFADVADDQTMTAAYYPTRTILTAPDQFLTLVPGTDALDLTRQIAEQYALEMGKVRSRLPLDLAIVYFHRKMPLYAVIDAARRFLEANPKSEEMWIVQKDHTTGQMPIAFTNGISWEIPTTFGDGNDDDFYPYVGLWDTNEMGDYSANGREYLHVKQLKAMQGIAVAPSRFSYLWLDASARRYAIGLPQDDAPFTTQGMYLEEIAQLTNMWGKMQDATITDTQLHGAVQLLMEKRMAWEKSATFTGFAKDVLQRTGLSTTGITANDVTDGRFFRCYDLHTRIMKQNLKPKSTQEAVRA